MLDSEQFRRDSQDLLKKSRNTLASAKNYSQTLGDAMIRLQRKGQELEGVEMGISAVIEDYRWDKKPMTEKFLDTLSHFGKTASDFEKALVPFWKTTYDFEKFFDTTLLCSRTRYVLPCQANAEKLYQSAVSLEAMFNNLVGVNANEALKAANVYQQIISAMDEARDAGFAAMDAALVAYSRSDPPGVKDLKIQAEESRVKSEDLSQVGDDA